jgi:adenosine deaminase CECR1
MTSVTAASENEYDDLAEDLPKLSDPFIQKYYDGRKALITQEEKQRSGMSHEPPTIHLK